MAQNSSPDDDFFAYRNRAFPGLHPYRLAGIATLHGYSPPNAAQARILELGDGDLTHSLITALSLPQADCVGVTSQADLLAQIRARVAHLQLPNLRLYSTDEWTERAATEDKFDYILVPEAYAVGDEAQRHALLSSCAAHLAAGGIACLRYPVLPGWSLRDSFRSLLHQQGAGGDLLDTLFHGLDKAPGPAHPEQESLLHSLRDREQREKFLATEPSALYFHQFIAQAQAQGLDYLADGKTDKRVDFSAEGSQHGRLLAAQYDDFQTHRGWRETLLCHPLSEPLRGLRKEQLNTLYLASPYRSLSEQPPLHFEGIPVRFENEQRDILVENFPLAKAALFYLGQQWPQAVSFQELHQGTLTCLQEAGLPEEALHSKLDYSLDSLLDIVYSHCQQQHLLVFAHPAPYATALTDYPQATSLARLHCQQNRYGLHNLRNEWLELPPLLANLLQHLDGTRSEEDLLNVVQDWAERGLIQSNYDGALNGSELRDSLRQLVRQALHMLLEKSLLLKTEVDHET